VLIGGGFVSFWGPVVGVVFYFVLRDVLGAYTQTWLLWFGLVFMAAVMFKPDGLAGMWQDAAAWLRRVRERGAAAPPAGR
jgi:branched-chain amino acid transport system permease protein